MSEPRSVPEHLLNDYLASLRMADSLVRDLAGPEAVPTEEAGRALPPVFQRAYHEIAGIYESVRRSRALLERAPVDRLQRTQEKLNEVTSATETAASDMLDGLDRALSLVDELDRDDGQPADSATCDRLREELFRVISCIQFQDITSQQIGYASSVLEDFERRMQVLLALLNRSMPEMVEDPPEPTRQGRTFDAGASTRDAGARQAVADEIFVQQPE